MKAIQFFLKLKNLDFQGKQLYKYFYLIYKVFNNFVYLIEVIKLKLTFIIIWMLSILELKIFYELLKTEQIQRLF